jgi:hypothetical protein
VAAAVGAARAGARTMLLESAGCLGGVWTAGCLTWIIDAGGKGGFMRELLDALQKRSPHIRKNKTGNGHPFDVEEMKILLEEFMQGAGVEIQLHTRVTGALVDQDGVLTHVFTESKSGRQAWSAGCFVDCTGDGDLAALAGCGYDIGKPESRECQPMSLVAMVTGIAPEHVRPFMGGGVAGPKEQLHREFVRAGVRPSYSSPILLHLFGEVFTLIANHEYGVSALDAAEITRATLRARREVHRLVAALRSLGGVWATLRVLKTADQIGIREGRRIHGHYEVTEEDLQAGRSHPDAICRVTFGVDVHHTDPREGMAMEEHHAPFLPYEIPLRALIARDVDGLVMAGRCISGDFIAHSSYRVTGNAVVMGEAAGVLAALAARQGLRPKEVPANQVLGLLETSRTNPAERSSAILFPTGQH